MEKLFIASETDFLRLVKQAVREEIEKISAHAAQPVNKQPAGTRPEVAEYLGISVAKLDIMVKTGEIKSYRIGRQVFFKWCEIEAYIKKK